MRFEPVSALYQQGKVRHVVEEGRDYALLEDEMVCFTPMDYEGDESPNRADALVWALTELMLGESHDAEFIEIV